MAERRYDQAPSQIVGGGFLGMEGHPDPATEVEVPGIGQSEWDRAGVERGTTLRTGGPKYKDSYKWLLNSLPVEHLVRLQETLEAVGFTKKMKLGALDDATVDNFVELLGIANRDGEDWQTTLGRLEEFSGGLGAVKEELPEFQPETFVRADPVALAEDVQALMKQRLKREPRPGEIDELVEELGGINRLRHEQDQELNELRFNAQLDGDVAPPEEFDKIDPAARFRKLFEEKYGGEIDHLEQVDDTAAQRDALEGNVAATDRYVRG